jgi:hypothetical protein
MSTKFHTQSHTFGPQPISSIAIREATDADRAALERIAARDSARPPAGDVLVAESGGELRAALELGSDRVVADPFRHTAELVDLLRARAAQIRAGRRAPLRVLARTPVAAPLRERAAA